MLQKVGRRTISYVLKVGRWFMRFTDLRGQTLHVSTGIWHFWIKIRL